MDNPKTIGNVNFLNLVNATEASVAGIHKIGNVNMAVYTSETLALLHRLNPDNINATLEVPLGVNVVFRTGQMGVNADFFKNAERPIYFFVTGQLVVEPGIPLADIEKSLAGVAVTGQFICPEDLMGAFNAKPMMVIGQSVSYPALGHFFKSSLTIEPVFLDSLEDGAELCVLGNLSVPKVLSNELLERKIGKVYVSGRVECHEENAQAIRSRLYKNVGDLKITPAGYAWVEKPLVLDADNLDYLPGKKLYCKDLVQISPDVDPQAFDRAVEGLIVEDMLLSPAALKPVLAGKCDLFATNAVFFADELWLVRDEQTWQEWRFKNLKGTATLVVTGELELDAAISSEALSQGLSKVYNYGLITCSAEQQAAIEPRLAARDGQIELTDGEKEPESPKEERPDYIANVNFLTL
jgi:hypothetical protein